MSISTCSNSNNDLPSDPSITVAKADKYGCRVRAAFKMAQRAIPLVADLDPVEVIYEDEDIIAVNKPAGVISAPKHRFTVSEALYQASAVHVAVICMGYQHCPTCPAHT